MNYIILTVLGIDINYLYVDNMKINLKFVILLLVVICHSAANCMDREHIQNIKKTFKYVGSELVEMGMLPYTLFYKPYYPPKQAAVEFTKTISKWYGRGSTALGIASLCSFYYKGIYLYKFSTAMVFSGLGSLGLYAHLNHKKDQSCLVGILKMNFLLLLIILLIKKNNGLGDCINATDRSVYAIERLKQGILKGKLDPSYKYYKDLDLLTKILINIEGSFTESKNMVNSNKNFLKFLIRNGARVKKHHINQILRKGIDDAYKVTGIYRSAASYGFGNYLLQIFTPQEILFKLTEGKIFTCQETVRQCLDVGVDIEAKDASGRTPLIVALQNKNFNTALSFIRMGAKVLNYKHKGKFFSPLSLIEGKGQSALEGVVKKRIRVTGEVLLRKADLFPEELVQHIASFIGPNFRPIIEINSSALCSDNSNQIEGEKSDSVN